MLSVFLIAFVAVAGSSATQPEGYLCCMPKQYEANVFEIGSAHKHEHHVEYILLGAFSYDQVNDVTAFSADYFVYPHTNVKSKIIMDYKLKKIYKIFKDKCIVSPFLTPFQYACIPGNAKKVAHFYMGMGKDILNADSYIAHYGGLTASIAITKECIVVGELVWGMYKEARLTMNVGYNNVTEGIKDPHVFTPPESCKHHNQTISDFPSPVQQIWDHIEGKFSREAMSEDKRGL